MAELEHMTLPSSQPPHGTSACGVYELGTHLGDPGPPLLPRLVTYILVLPACLGRGTGV